MTARTSHHRLSLCDRSAELSDPSSMLRMLSAAKAKTCDASPEVTWQVHASRLPLVRQQAACQQPIHEMPTGELLGIHPECVPANMRE
jgi:hypothetical protein